MIVTVLHPIQLVQIKHGAEYPKTHPAGAKVNVDDWTKKYLQSIGYVRKYKRKSRPS